MLAQLAEHSEEPRARAAAQQREVVVLRLLLLLLHVDQRRVVVVSLDVDQPRVLAMLAVLAVVLGLAAIWVGAAHGGYRGGLKEVVRRARYTRAVQWLAAAE